MWAVIKYKNKELNLLKKNFTKVLGEAPQYYCPKIQYKKYIKRQLRTCEKLILENYLICYHPKFNDVGVINKLKYSKGLSYFLNGYQKNQKDIIQFIKHCKKYENSEGYINQDFFEYTNLKKARFISGPFANMIFEIISNQSTKLKILINGLTTTISKKSNYFYRPV